MSSNRSTLAGMGASEGKGTLGCIVSLALIAVVVIAGIRIFPVYYSVKGFETDVKTEVSRAGAHFMTDETLMGNLLQLAKRNELRLKREDITLERMAGQVFVTIRYQTPVDLLLFEHTFDFNIKASSFIGRL